MPGEGLTHGPRAKKMHAAVTTGSAKSSGIPCAMVLRLIARSPRGPGSFAPVIGEIISRQLDTSVGVSGPHVLIVRQLRATKCFEISTLALSTLCGDTAVSPN